MTNTDVQGHHPYCANNVLCSVEESYPGKTWAEKRAIARDWLEDGTTECICSDFTRGN